MNIQDPLTPEERELAELLGAPHLSDGPSPDVDARIFAMAREAVVAAPASSAPMSAPVLAPRRSGWGRRRGLASSLAVAASLVLVVGLAWQLRPLPTQPEMQSVASDSAAAPPSAAADASSANAADVAAPAPAANVEMAIAPAADIAAMPPAPPVAPVLKPELPISQAPPASRAAAPALARAQAEAPIAQQPEANVETAMRSMKTAPALSAPAPAPAPPAPEPAAMMSEVSAPAAMDRATQTDVQERSGNSLRTGRPSFAPGGRIPHAPEKLVRKARAAAPAPPEPVSVTSTPVGIDADARLSRRHWLKRIHERRDNGDVEGARASLQRFVIAHPDTRVPSDLQDLLSE